MPSMPAHPRTALTAALAAVLLVTGGGGSSANAMGAEPRTHTTTVKAAADLSLGATATPGLTRLLATGTAGNRGIATFDSTPSESQVAALEGLGLTVQPMHRLPMALIRGPLAALRAAVVDGIANDVYSDEPIHLLDAASSDAHGCRRAARPRATGQGNHRRGGRLWVRRDPS